MVICLEQGADLHTAQLMPLPLTVSCFSKLQIGFTFLVLAHPGSPGKRAVKRVCVCVCLCVCVCVHTSLVYLINSLLSESSACNIKYIMVTDVTTCLDQPILCSAILTLQRVTDRETNGRTDRWTHKDSICQASIALRSKNSQFKGSTQGQLSLASLRGRLIEYQFRLG